MDMGLPMDDEYAHLAQLEARQRKLGFCRLQGDLRLLRNLISGRWVSDDFLVVAPGKTVASEDEGQIVVSVNA